MKKAIGTLWVGKYGFTIDFTNDFKDGLHVNYPIFINFEEGLPDCAKNTEQQVQADPTDNLT
jgi:hypothetical protein